MVNTGKYYGVFDITEISQNPSKHRGGNEKFMMGLKEALENGDNGHDVSGLIGAGKREGHSFEKWPNAQKPVKDFNGANVKFMGICVEPPRR